MGMAKSESGKRVLQALDHLQSFLSGKSTAPPLNPRFASAAVPADGTHSKASPDRGEKAKQELEACPKNAVLSVWEKQ